MRNLYIRWLLVLALFAGVGLLPVFASDPWNGAYTQGRGLWHLDTLTDAGSPSALADGTPAVVKGNVALDTTIKVYGSGAMHFIDGSLTMAKCPLQGGNRSFEAFIRVAAFPEKGKEACLFTFSDTAGKPVHQLTLTSDGGLKLTFIYRDYLQERYSETGVIVAPAGTVPAGKWVHVGFSALGYYNMVRFMCNGNIIDEAHGAMYDGEYQLTVGAAPDGTQAFKGWIDEIRSAEETIFSTYSAPQQVVSPAVNAKERNNPRYFPNKDNATLLLTFDDSIDPVMTKADDKKSSWLFPALPPRFAEGLHGKALGLGSPMFIPAKGVLRPEAGTVSYWVRVRENADQMGRTFKIGDGWDFMISGSHGFYAVDRSGRGGVLGGDYWGAIRNLSPKRWHLITLTWLGENVKTYIDGQRGSAFFIPDGLAPYMTGDLRIGIGDSWEKYGEQVNALLDEYRVFSAALSDEEVSNLYSIEMGGTLKTIPARYTQFDTYPGLRTIVATVPQEIPGVTAGKNLTLSLVDSKGKTVASTTAVKMLLGNAQLHLPYPALSTGDYKIVVTQQSSPQPGKKTVAVVNDWQSYHIDAAPWLQEHAGVTDKVLPLWTPLAATANTIRVVNRQITLDTSGLPKAIDVAGSPLLAAGAYFEVETAKGISKLSAPAAGLKQVSASDTKAVYQATINHEAFILTLTNETEYDGCAKITVRLSPSKTPGEIKRLTLVLPLAKDAAKYINAKGKGIREQYLLGALPAQDGRVFASYILSACAIKSDPIKLLADYAQKAQFEQDGKPLPENLQSLATRSTEVTSGNFMPYLWIGTPERGLCWFADNDKGWVRGDMQTPAVEVKQVSGNEPCTEIRINLIAAPVTITAERTLVFGLQPTPVRQLPADWRKFYWGSNLAILGFGYEFQSGRFYKNQGCPGAYGGDPYPLDVKRAQWFAPFMKKQHLLQIPYFEFTNTYNAVTGPYALEWRQLPQAWCLQGGILPIQSYADWFSYYFKRYVKDVGIDGLYLDNVCPLPSLNEWAHGAWRDDKNQLQGSYNLWAQREMLRRLRTTMVENGLAHPWMQTHMTHANIIPSLGYADVLYDGEDFYPAPENTWDFMDAWPLDTLTAIDTPETWGVPTRFLGHIRGGDWSKKPGGEEGAMRTGIGALLLVDCMSDHIRYPLGNILRSMQLWGVEQADCRFIGHWTNRLTANDPEIKVSAYQRPDTLLLVVTNYAHEAKTGQITFSAKDLLSFTPEQALLADGEVKKDTLGADPYHADLKCSASAQGDTWTVTVGPISPRDFRLITITKK